MQDPRSIRIEDYSYDLPNERIALHPLAERDASKLLYYADGQIKESTYGKLPDLLPANSLLIFNNSKVIRARLRFQTQTGARVEVFCLEPHGPMPDYQQVMQQTGSTTWQCLVGGAAKWKEGPLMCNIQHQNQSIQIQAEKTGRSGDAFLLEFHWQPADLCFAEILHLAGDIPLPPYIKRSSITEDETRYQTVFAQAAGSVAAPTAGLHFTESLLQHLEDAGMKKEFLTLHVGAGTFLPVKSQTLEGHTMHAEWISVSRESLCRIRDHKGPRVAVGTTSLRSLETIYWMGVQAGLFPDAPLNGPDQWDVYTEPFVSAEVDLTTSLHQLIHWMDTRSMTSLVTQTRLLIVPGYRFRVADWIITNFHQPQSTLLLLIAAATGESWRSIYRYALEHAFRFLSYGDGSLLKIRTGPQG